MSENPGESGLITLGKRYRAAIQKQDTEAMKRITSAYTGIYERLQDKIQLLIDELIQLENPTAWKVRRLERYIQLLEQTRKELTKFSEYLEVELGTVGRQSIELGLNSSRELIRAAAGEQIAIGQLRGLTPAVMQTLTGFLSPESKLFKRIQQIAPDTVEQIANTILEGVGFGKNPRVIAADITSRLGMGLTSALRHTRTVQIYSYREANRANYLANNDIVRGWYWMSALDPLRTCLGCVAEHGTFHELDETMNDHYNGLCVPLPAVIGAPAPIETGEEYFKSLSDTEQQAWMGNDKYTAWTEGKFEFSQLATQHEDEVYGSMIGEASFKSLVGENDG